MGDERLRFRAIGVLVALAVHAGVAVVASLPHDSSGGDGFAALTGLRGQRQSSTGERTVSRTRAFDRTSNRRASSTSVDTTVVNQLGQVSSADAARPPRATASGRDPSATLRTAFADALTIGRQSFDPSDRWGAFRPLLNHLWQSTLFVLLAGLLALAFRRHEARVRYWLWCAASVKFLIPFAVLTSLGGWFGAGGSAEQVSVVRAVAEPISDTIVRIGSPFARGWQDEALLASTAPQGKLAFAIVAVWAGGFVAIALVRLALWRRVVTAVRASVPYRRVTMGSLTFPPHVQVRLASSLLEPGVVGFWRPILLLPAGIEEHLTEPQLDAVLAHELCHIERRDNVTAAVHMFVEAIFWFHPLVWWIGARLVDERERACDEEVLRRFRNPRAYADGIVRLCKRYVEASLACVAGVSGSDLKKRIEEIMRDQDRQALGFGRKFVLAAAACSAVAVPMTVGALREPVVRAQSPAGVTAASGLSTAPTSQRFETASVKPNQPGDRMGGGVMSQPGGRLAGTNVTLGELIRFAYDLPAVQVSGGPGWLNSDRFSVVGKAAGDAPVAQKRLMLRTLLNERFRLAAHAEKRELPFYALTKARSDGRLGPRLRTASVDCARADLTAENGIGLAPDGTPPCGFFGFAPGTHFGAGRGGLAFRGMTMGALSKVLVPMVRRVVIDQTAMEGYFDADFDFIAELPLPPPPPGVPAPTFDAPFVSVFTVFSEQLGLKLESRRGPIDVLVIDGAVPPTPD